MQNSKSGALLWGLDLKYRSQIRKTATGLGQSEELPGRGRGSPFIAGTSLLSTTLKAGQNLSGSGLSTGPGLAGQVVNTYLLHILIESFHFWPSLSLWTSYFHLFLYLPSLWSFSFSFCHSVPTSFPHCWLLPDLFAVPLPPHHTALWRWLTMTQCSTPLMTDVSDCCLLSERFYTYSLTST